MSSNQHILNLASSLIAIQSTPESDHDQIIVFLSQWLEEFKIPHTILTENGVKTGIVITIPGTDWKQHPICLNACLDTAQFGQLNDWSSHPLSPIIENGWLRGRGSADSKIAVSIFCEIAKCLIVNKVLLKRPLHFLFDAFEHDGSFKGIKSYLKLPEPAVDYVIGYPGNDSIKIGARGFARCEIIISGSPMHSGSSKDKDNPIHHAAQFVCRVTETFAEFSKRLHSTISPDLNITSFHSGLGFSQIPSRAKLRIDCRLSDKMTNEDFKTLVCRAAGPILDKLSIRWAESWPAYTLDEKLEHVDTLKSIAEAEFEKPIPLQMSGPSNIGNLLAEYGGRAICGFGVTAVNIHAPNEAIDISTIMPIFRIYKTLVERLCT